MEIQELFKELVDAGYKLTKPRKVVAEWIINYKGVFSVSNVSKELRYLDKVTIYRTLNLFCKLDIIHGVISINGEQYFEVHGNVHHHHVVCTECKRSECIPCKVPEMKIPNFKHIHHSLVFTGLCKMCSN